MISRIDPSLVERKIKLDLILSGFENYLNEIENYL